MPTGWASTRLASTVRGMRRRTPTIMGIPVSFVYPSSHCHIIHSRDVSSLGTPSAGGIPHPHHGFDMDLAFPHHLQILVCLGLGLSLSLSLSPGLSQSQSWFWSLSLSLSFGVSASTAVLAVSLSPPSTFMALFLGRQSHP